MRLLWTETERGPSAGVPDSAGGGQPDPRGGDSDTAPGGRVPSGARPFVFDQRQDPAKPFILGIFGRKASGKSVLARVYWDSWPFDRLTIDPAGDFPGGADNEELTEPLPGRWPSPPALDDGPQRVSRSFRPDPGSPTYADDIDRAIGLIWTADRDRPKLLLVDEIAEVTSANKTGPNMRRVLHQSRHRRLSVITCGPRCKDINPLVLTQSDEVCIFELPSVLDQQRLAESLGIPLRVLQAALADLPKYHYLKYTAQPDPKVAHELGVDVAQLRLIQMPPVKLPAAA